MKKRLIKALAIATIVITTASCAGRKPQPVQVQQSGDFSKSCAFLKSEVDQCENEIDRLLKINNQKTAYNVGVGLAGVVVFPPLLLFMNVSDAEKVESNALNQRRTYLINVSLDKDCQWCKDVNIEENMDYLAVLEKKKSKKAQAKDENYSHEH